MVAASEPGPAVVGSVIQTPEEVESPCQSTNNEKYVFGSTTQFRFYSPAWVIHAVKT